MRDDRDPAAAAAALLDTATKLRNLIDQILILAAKDLPVPPDVSLQIAETLRVVHGALVDAATAVVSATVGNQNGE
jgi:hypothetical protein